MYPSLPSSSCYLHPTRTATQRFAGDTRTFSSVLSGRDPDALAYLISKGTGPCEPAPRPFHVRRAARKSGGPAGPLQARDYDASTLFPRASPFLGKLIPCPSPDHLPTISRPSHDHLTTISRPSHLRLIPTRPKLTFIPVEL
jgi:hypothetical protein